ncbi:hypothetical protein SAMN05216251_12218 [Actinacidiphila alni]|uniref:Uncharacterized protein n=1 Tax=Actinacidiphila alni TaxID=380248 RepID=A0A1I2KE79_9ACTN|nr:hypothetical protein SAMN05216251_12218 [Actinacidiphila alni]
MTGIIDGRGAAPARVRTPGVRFPTVVPLPSGGAV